MATSSGAAVVECLRASASSTALISFIFGIATHLAVRPYEIDDKGWEIFFSYFALEAGLGVAYYCVAGLSLLRAVSQIFVVGTAFNIGIFGSILVYRAFFHRLRSFPGPFPAKLSRFYALKNAATACQNNIVVQNLHAQYGDFVRIGPREISINRPSAIRPVYEPPTQTSRSPWYAQVSNDVTKISLNSTRVHKVHKARKKAWERGLGSRALAVYEPRVMAKASLLLSRIANQIGRPLDVTANAMFYGFDVMADVGLSKDFRMLQSSEEHPAVKGIHDSMEAIGVLGTVPWLLSMLSKIPGAAGGYGKFIIWCHDQVLAKRQALAAEKVADKDQDPRDIMSWLLKAKDEGDNSAPPGELAIQEDARLLIIAGSDTTSAALTNALFYLAGNPIIYKRLRTAVKEKFPSGMDGWNYADTKVIAYLDWVINETLRLKPSVPGGLTRLTPPQGLQVDDVFIPGDTVVSVPTYTIQRDARYWPDALDFKPERWEGLSTEKAPWLPFTRGQWACPGKNLAYMELRMVLSQIALKYDVAFADKDEAERFDRDVKDTFTLTLPPLHLLFT